MARTGTRTFADRSLPTSAIAAVVREMEGCSAGILIVVLRALAPDAADGRSLAGGVYEAIVRQGRLSFEPLDPRPDIAWRIVADPRPLAFASALLVPMEGRPDGRWMARLRAVAGEWGVAVAAADGLVPALVLGAKPDAAQVRLERATAWPTFGLAAAGACPAPAGRPEGFAFIAGPVPVGCGRVYATGRSADPRVAVRKSEAEAWERRGWAMPGAVHAGRMGDMMGALDPRAFVAYGAAQYARPSFPFRRFEPRCSYLWTSGVDVLSGETVALPVECVRAARALPDDYAGAPLTSSTSSGVAAWTDPDGALCRATLELLERDAFLRCWTAQRSPVNLRGDALPIAAQLRIEGLRSTGHKVRVAQIATVPVAVVTVFLQHEAAGFTAITAAADFRAEEALARALDEAEGRAAHAAAYPQAPIDDAEEVGGLAGLLRMYQTRVWFRQADFYATGPESARLAGGACTDWPALQAWLAARRRRLLAFDLTPPGASLDQGRTRLHVVRAIVPGLVPIWFGRGLEPAGLPVFRRLLRQRPTPATSSGLLHPLS